MINPSKFFILTLLFLIIGCVTKKNPAPDKFSEDVSYLEMLNMIPDTTAIVQVKQFYELEHSIEDIKKEIEVLQSHVMEYKYQSTETDYSKKLKEFIDKPLASHKIFLNNSSIIEGTIEKDKQFSLLVDTDVGKLTINKSDINKIEDLVIPLADIVFLGHGIEEISKNNRNYSGKIINQGNRRGDFVRIIYSLWDENTNLIISDSTFVNGPQVVYKSGIITDTILEPNQSTRFTLNIAISDSINVTYVTRDIRWEFYD